MRSGPRAPRRERRGAQWMRSLWTRIDRLAGRDLMRIDRNELEAALAIRLELAERRQLAELAARIVDREGAVERLELVRETEHGLAQLHLVEAGRDRQRLFDHQPGRVAGHSVEAELELAVRVLLLPGRVEIRHLHAEVDRVVELRRRHVGED